MVYKGQDAQLTVAREETFKTRPTSVDQQPGGIVMDSVDGGESKDKSEIRGMGGDRNYVQLTDTGQEKEVGFSTYLQNAKMFEFVLGAISENDDSATSAPYTHVITEAQDMPSMAIEHVEFDQDGSDDLITTWVGSKIDEATLTSSKGEPGVQVEYSLLCGGEVDNGTTDSTSLLSDRPFKHKDLSTLEFNSNAINSCSELEISVTNNLERVPENGGFEDSDLIPLNREYEITVTHVPKDSTHYQAWENSTEAGFTVEYQRGGNPDDSLLFEFSGAQIQEPGWSRPLDDVEEAEMTIRAKSLTLTVTSSSESYSLS